MRVAGRTPPARLADEGAALQGEVAVSPGMIAVTGLHLNALDQNLEGALAFSFAGKPSLSGSLDAKLIDLERVLARAPPLVDSAGAWSMDALPPSMTAMMDLDLRLSAGEVRWRGHSVQNAAFSVMNGGGKLDVTMVEAAAYGGSLKGEATLAPTEGGFQAHAAATLKGADVGPLAAAFGWSAVSGTVDGEFVLDTTGDCPAGMARALTGTASAKLSNGIVEGLSFEKALRRSERKPIDLGNDILTGRTVVNDAAVAIAIDKGDARIVDAWAFGPGLRLTLAGWTDLSDRRVEARATAIQGDGEGAPEKDGARLSLDISGPWSTPIVKASASGGG
jgi:AsmA protein